MVFRLIFVRFAFDFVHFIRRKTAEVAGCLGAAMHLGLHDSLSSSALLVVLVFSVGSSFVVGIAEHGENCNFPVHGAVKTMKCDASD